MSFNVSDFDCKQVNFCIASITNLSPWSFSELEKTKNLALAGSPNNEVRAVWFTDFLLPAVPKNLNDFFPNIALLSINNCQLKELTRKDLKNYQHLKAFCAAENQIVNLPADLFEGFENLETLKFRSNKINFIGKNIFKHLTKLKCVDLKNNPSINLIYADETCNELIFDKTETRITKLSELNAILDGVFPALPKKFADLENVLKVEEFKDFSIKIGNHEFTTHKLILAARSPTLAEMIKNNPDADELILEGIEVEVFRVILDFIYDDKMPEEYDESSSKVFAAAGRLKLDDLKDQIGKVLCSSLNSENCFDVLIHASKHGHDELKKKAFDEVKLLYPGKVLKNELMDNIEMIQKMKKMREEFEKLFVSI